MSSSTSSRVTTRALSAALLASMSIAVLVGPVSAGDCTYTFPDDGGKYPGGTVVAGDVICGGPGDDYVATMEGGRFLGRRGDDSVETMAGGQFFGGVGADTVYVVGDGIGKIAADLALVATGASFHGGPGNDAAETVSAGSTFFGGSGRDSVNELVGLFRAGPDPDDVFRMTDGARFFGARGNDAVDRDGGEFNSGAMFGTSHFNGGRGSDFADICGTEATIVSVESTSDDCPGGG